VVVANAYDDLAAEWDGAAGPVYRPLARLLVQASPVPLAARLILDVGSGTGAVTQAAEAVGARVVAADRSFSMAAHVRGRGWSAMAADGLALPVGDGVFDAALAGFLLNHLPPRPTLTEMGRAVRAGGIVLATTWDASRPDPVKQAIDATLVSRGWVRPTWYRRLKAEVEPVSGDPRCLKEAAEEAGLIDVVATVNRPELPIRDPHAVVAYRLAMAHIAPWVAALDQPQYAELVREAQAVVTPLVGTWRPAAIVLTGSVGAHPKERDAARSRPSV
jgi:SAM-dependent methyltransferase